MKLVDAKILNSHFFLDRTQVQFIAYLTMSIDHLGVLFFPQCDYLRGLGRIAFPLFAYFTVIGILRTRSVRGYLGRMVGLLILSEPAFDLAFYGEFFHADSQSVIPTLLVGACVLAIIENLHHFQTNNGIYVKFIHLTVNVGTVVFGIAIAVLIASDYAGIGVGLIIAMYWMRTPLSLTVVGLIFGLISMLYFGLLGLIGVMLGISVLLLYDVDRHPKRFLPKWLTWGFYPGHLLLLAGASALI